MLISPLLLQDVRWVVFTDLLTWLHFELLQPLNDGNLSDCEQEDRRANQINGCLLSHATFNATFFYIVFPSLSSSGNTVTLKQVVMHGTGTEYTTASV